MTATNQTVQGCFLLQLGIVDVVHRAQALFKDFADSQQFFIVIYDVHIFAFFVGADAHQDQITAR